MQFEIMLLTILNLLFIMEIKSLYSVRQIPSFFFRNALKKTTEYFLKLIFLFANTNCQPFFFFLI